jgi:glycosyltransferase involved in cell wall biosynthesis
MATETPRPVSPRISRLPWLERGLAMKKETIRGINILTLHRPDDARVFARQARSLLEVSDTVRLIAPAGESGLRDGVEVIGVGRSRRRFQNFFVTPWRLLATHVRRPAEMAYLHDAPLLYLAPLLRALGTTVVYDVHEDYANMLRHREWVPRLLRPFLGSFVGVYEHAMARFVSGIVAATAPLLDDFPHRVKAAVYNLPTGDLVALGGRQTTPLSQREFDLVHLGSLSDVRMAFLGDVLERVFAERPETRVMMVGLWPHQVRWFRERWSEEQVTIHERLPHAEVPDELGRCRIGLDVHPWLLPHLALAVPVKNFEYMACGCALLSSHLPEFERLLEAEDLAAVEIVHGDDPSTYARQALALLARPDELARRSARLREQLPKRYTWEHERQKLLDLFLAVAARRRGVVEEER